MARARRAKGKRSFAISDQSGFKIPYKSLKTTWEGLRVEPEEWDPKHPQLTPARNVIDAVALFQPRPDNDPENVEILLGYTYDPFIDQRQRPPVGVPCFGRVSQSSVITIEFTVTGVSGTGAVGNVATGAAVDGVQGVGATGTAVPNTVINISVTGVEGTTNTGDETATAEGTPSGVAGTEGIGTSSGELTSLPTGVSGTGDVEGFGVEGDGNVQLIVTGLSGVGSTGTTGDEIASAIVSETGLSATGATGTPEIQINYGWGEGTWSSDAWGE